MYQWNFVEDIFIVNYNFHTVFPFQGYECSAVFSRDKIINLGWSFIIGKTLAYVCQNNSFLCEKSVYWYPLYVTDFLSYVSVNVNLNLLLSQEINI